jgi:glycosyltransferase involved in cell wall biosynthesis
MHVVTPSNWLADCVRSSSLMTDWPTTVIPYALDTETWAPVDRQAARAELGLPGDATLILFGADGGMAHPIKGADLLEAAVHRLPMHLSKLALDHKDVRLVVFGGDGPRLEPAGRLPFPVIHLGRVDADERLRATYSACDVMVVPSRLEAFGFVALEAQACGTPVVAYSVGGLTDIVEDRLTGRLCDPFDTDQLATAIAWVVEDRDRNRALGRAGRIKASKLSNPEFVASTYVDVYYRSVSSSR